jgi:hypothetical protein
VASVVGAMSVAVESAMMNSCSLYNYYTIAILDLHVFAFCLCKKDGRRQ